MPALAAVEFQYGGVFRTRWISSNNISDGSSDTGLIQNDNNNQFDQRLRLYLTFKASENLKVVWKMEVGNITWGDTRWNNGGRMGADGVNVKTKNAYVQFNIPNTPTTAVIGIQGIALLDSWLVDDDFSAAAFVTKIDNFTITLAYISGQNAYQKTGNEGEYYYSSTKENVDDYAFAVTYAQKGLPIKATLTGVFMNANMGSLGSVSRSHAVAFRQRSLRRQRERGARALPGRPDIRTWPLCPPRFSRTTMQQPPRMLSATSHGSATGWMD